MKLAFTTLGCPQWDVATILSRAVEYGYDGVDWRGCQDAMRIYELPEFSTRKHETAKRFGDAGMDVPCFSSSCGLMPQEGQDREAVMDELRAYAELCAVFGARYIRVFGHGIGERSWEEAIEVAAASLKEMASIAGDHGAKVLLETHDAWVHSEHIRALMEAADTEQAGVLWDVHHPWLVGETPAQTWEALGRWIEYTHWKDAHEPAHELCLMGEGDLPLDEFQRVMSEGGYAGYYTLEWEKRWHEELAEPEVALPQYVAFMKGLAGD